MPIEIVHNTFVVAFGLIVIACLYLVLFPVSRLPDGRLKFTGGPVDLSVQRRRYVVCMVIGILIVVSLLPICHASRDRAFASMFNNPREWVSQELPAEKSYASFVWRFQELDAVVVSWPDCHIDDQRLVRLDHELTESGNPQRFELCEQFFARVVTGYDAVRELMAPPLALTSEDAARRLEGCLVGPDGRTSCAVVYLRQTGENHRAEAVNLLRNIVQDVCQVPPEDVVLAGGPVDGMTIDRNSVASADRYAIPSNILVFLLCRFCLRSWRLTGVIFGIALFGQLLAVALIAWCGANMNAILIVVPPLTLVLTVSAGVHLVNYYHDEVRLHGQVGAAGRAVRIGALPCMVATATTVVGLLSLLASDSPAIVLFALFSSICILATISLLFMILPGAMEIWPVPARSEGPGGRIAPLSGRLAERMTRFVCMYKRSLLVGCLTVMVIGLYGLATLRTSVNVRAMFPEKSQILRNYHWLEKNIGPTVPIEVVLQINRDEQIEPLAQLRLVRDVHNCIAGMDGVGGVFSAATFSPDLTGSSGEFAGDNGFSIWDLSVLRNRMVEMSRMRETRHARFWRITARVPALGNVDYGEVLDRLANHVDPILDQASTHFPARSVSVVYTGPMPVTYAAQQTLLSDLIKSFATALVLITIVMMIYLRSIIAGLVVMIPNLFPTVLLFGFTSVCGIAVDIGSVMTASVALGIAVDDTLHFLTWYRREHATGRDAADAVRKAYDHCGWAMLQSTLICGCGMLVYTMSSFIPAQRFALMMIALLAMALAGDLFLLPAMLLGPFGKWLRPTVNEVVEDSPLWGVTHAPQPGLEPIKSL